MRTLRERSLAKPHPKQGDLLGGPAPSEVSAQANMACGSPSERGGGGGSV